MTNKVEWVSVECRLPDFKPVFAYIPQFHLIIVAVFSSTKKIFYLESYPSEYWCIEDVSHWAELPEPPENK